VSYIYKIVSLQEYLNTPNANKPKSYQTPYAREVNLGQVIQSLLNKYAKEGWEFERIEELKPKDFQGTASKAISTFMMGNRKDEDNYLEQNFKYFIFKKPFSESLLLEMEKTQMSSEELSQDLSKVDIDDVTKRSKKVLDKLVIVGYETNQAVVSAQKTYWKITYKGNGSVSEFFNIEELEKYAKNF